MKRLHVNLAVADLDATVRFYSGLFGAAPSVLKPDYAKWMLDDPRVNFAVSTRRVAEGGHPPGLDHLGIQVETPEALAEAYGRMRAAAGPMREDGAITCCYARSEKAWVSDPAGIAWEAFLTSGEATTYGDGSIGGPRLASDGEAPRVAPPVAVAAACCG